MIPRAAAESQSERRRPDRAWTRREYKGRKKPLHRLLIVTIATVTLVVVGGITAPSTVSGSALQLLLPFFAVLAVASIGQHLVIQQRGLDLSTAGIMAFAFEPIAVHFFVLQQQADRIGQLQLASGSKRGAL